MQALGSSVQARLYPAVRQRRPLLTAGLCGFAAPAIGPLIAETPLTVAVLAVEFSMQIRLYPTARQRLPLLTAGLCGFPALAVVQLIAETP
ncbi:hypothetical protein AB0383_47260 [Amycolatopsis sp. NPDC051373]|uniref:hypothetical protein n=1 Tax=Amycolatopsis sp. NPDC051373 TaxID=3155801 RepID=UPI00344FD5C5